MNIRLGGDASPELSKELFDKLGGVYAVTGEGGRGFVGSSSVRYYYKEDEPLAKQIATTTNDILRQLDANNLRNQPRTRSCLLNRPGRI